MIRNAEKSTIERILIWTAILATIVVTPWFSYDPINVPKMAIIAIGAFSSFGMLSVVIGKNFIKNFKTEALIVGLFVLNLTIVLIFSGDNFYQEFFGTFGRATGYVAYVALSLIFLASVAISHALFLKKLANVVLLGGLLSVIYGIFQSFKIDPIDWVNPYSPVVGFLGNPNFQSSFVGFSGIVAFSHLLENKLKVGKRFMLVMYLVASAYVIYSTDSQQGFLVLAGGIGIVVLFRIKNSRFSAVSIPLTGLAIVVVGIVILGTLNKGPLSSLLYKLSVTYRGDYWRAGWKMTLEHPFLGVGLDSYGDWYRRSRTVEATLRRGPEIVSNAAHNVLLDLSSNGGFPLLVIYFLLMGLVLRAITRLMKRSSTFNPSLCGLIAMWIAYQAQSIISLNQLGLAVWGWLISGAIIGYEINTRSVEQVQAEKPNKQKAKPAIGITTTEILPSSLLGLFVGFVIGCVIGMPPVIASSKYLSALKSQDATKVEQVAFLWPQEPARVGQIVGALANAKLETQALNIVTRGVERFPDDYELWNYLSQMPNATDEQKSMAKSEMKRLDPHNPDLK
jgi:O-antigen ligase